MNSSTSQIGEMLGWVWLVASVGNPHSGEEQGQLPCMQQSWRGRPNSPVRAGQTLGGRASWAWPLDINMALGGSPNHGHPHGLRW